MKQSRIEGLDLMRTIAISLVLIGHSLIFIPIHIRNFISPFIPDGVSIFFVLSGYLIGKILWEDLQGSPIKKSELFHFWKRRWFRTLPNYFFTLIVIIILSKLLGKEIKVSLFQYFTFIQNFNTPQTEDFFPESWSLSVEEWFYILLPIFLLCLSYLKISRINMFSFSFIFFFIISLIFRINIFSKLEIIDIHTFDLWIRKTVLGRLDSIFFGVAFYILIHVKKVINLEKAGYYIIISISIYLINVIFKSYFNGYLYSTLFYFPIESISICLSIPYFLNTNIKQQYLFKFSHLTSKYSYSLYLVNFSIVKLLILDSFTITNPYINRPIKFLLFIPLSYLIAYIFYNCIEQPFLKLRDKY